MSLHKRDRHHFQGIVNDRDETVSIPGDIKHCVGSDVIRLTKRPPRVDKVFECIRHNDPRPTIKGGSRIGVLLGERVDDIAANEYPRNPCRSHLWDPRGGERQRAAEAPRPADGTRLHPVFYAKAFNALEVTGVTRDHGQVVRQSNCGDAHIRLTQWCPRPFQLSSERPIRLRGATIEGEDTNMRPDAFLKLLQKVFALCAPVCTVHHLPHGDGRRKLLLGGDRGQAGEQTWGWSAPEDLA
jgi:hypothetical protein